MIKYLFSLKNSPLWHFFQACSVSEAHFKNLLELDYAECKALVNAAQLSGAQSTRSLRLSASASAAQILIAEC